MPGGMPGMPGGMHPGMMGPGGSWQHMQSGNPASRDYDPSKGNNVKKILDI
jgi:hypothetical protein